MIAISSSPKQCLIKSTFIFCLNLHEILKNRFLIYFKDTLQRLTKNAKTYLQLPLRQWGAGNVYLLVLSSWKVNIAKNPIAVMGL